MRFSVPATRASMEDAGTSFRIAIPARASWVAVVLLVCLVSLWGLVEEKVLQDKLGIHSPGGSLFAIVWTFAGIALGYIAVWMAIGKERISLDSSRIVIERKPVSFPGRRVFDTARVRRLRVAPVHPAMRSQGLETLRDGPIAFDYGNRTFRFGGSIGEAQAVEIVQAVTTRFPDLAA